MAGAPVLGFGLPSEGGRQGSSGDVQRSVAGAAQLQAEPSHSLWLITPAWPVLSSCSAKEASPELYF